MKTDDLIRLLDLAPLPGEGGYFRRTHEGPTDPNGRAAYSVIYYLLTPDQPRSQLHWLPIAETYHFYLGDPVEMLILEKGTSGRTLILGQDIGAGQQVQMQVPANCWHGSHLMEGGEFALLGTTMTPGYMDQDYRPADRAGLQRQFPNHAQLIQTLTGEI
ncbi:MAG: cupin [Robiginitomaculum sp.]|nr:MAG: cupin [Robiginitomaculum sp.]